MIFIENIYICLAAPILIAVLCLRGKRRGHVLFLFGGITACFLSSYVTTWVAGSIQADKLSATIEVAPFVEELMKFAPVLFYLMVMKPKKEEIAERILMVSVGFATLENVCFLMMDGSDHLLHLLIRGFGAGAMHVVCGTIVSAGIVWLWENHWLRNVGTVGLLAVAITYHGVYNTLVSQTGAPAIIGYLIPLLTTVIVVVIRSLVSKKALQ